MIKQFSFSGNPSNIERDIIDTDVLIVGGGPAGLATAIKLKQMALTENRELDVTLIEKGADIGSHILSGNCFESKALSELIPDWKAKGAPVGTEVTKDRFVILTKNQALSIPEFLLPKGVHNKGNHIISLSELCKWLGTQAEELGVNVYTGFAGKTYNLNKESNAIEGVITGDFGISKKGEMMESFSPGSIIRAKATILAEGCRGSITESVLDKYNLRKVNQHYGLGLKEVWEVPSNHPHFHKGLVQHTVYWPLDSKTYGGTFMYHMAPNLIHIGMVIGLDYKNPHLNLYEEFQRWKLHKEVRKYLEGGTCISYGARSLNEGGYYSVPKMNFPGGMIIGCAAGLLDVAKIKGTHNAIRSGILAAETIYNKYKSNGFELEYGLDYEDFQKAMQDSNILKELHVTRNFQGAFSKGGLFFGLIHGFITNLIKGKEFWSFKPSKADSKSLVPASQAIKIDYPKPDGVLTFNLLDNLARSGTNHNHDQPSHLKIKINQEFDSLKSLSEYDGPEQRFCPAKVYEFVDDSQGKKKLQINAQNCLHCKCCSIKMVNEYIDWNVPEGGGGPKYTIM